LPAFSFANLRRKAGTSRLAIWTYRKPPAFNGVLDACKTKD
jgi:hypothetical protein